MSSEIGAEQFVGALRAYGVRAVTGVPCGHLAGPWALLDAAGDLTPAACEGSALAIAAGWELAGRTTAVLAQNSGLGNMINPLASLVLPYRIPQLVVMTMRGWPDPASDEPQHASMGAATVPILDSLDVRYTIVQPDALDTAFALARAQRRQGKPFFLLVPRGAIGRTQPVAVEPSAAALTRPRVVASLLARLTEELLVTTTGYLSRQTHHDHDRPGTFYMQGSMGHAAAIGLGLATAHPHRRTVILDGDGALLMHLGIGSTIGASGAGNLVHVVVDNGCYESTGCQRSTSHSVNWIALGISLGYRNVYSIDDAGNLEELLQVALAAPGPVLLALKVVPTPREVHARATASIGLDHIARRFREAAADIRSPAVLP
jgi:phosphonopyruvate decarboxylase